MTTYTYFIPYEWTGPDGFGKDWLCVDASAPLDTGDKIFDVCQQMIEARPDYSRVVPLNIALIRTKD